SGKDVFLSHCSKDDEMVPGVVDLLEQHGASVYADDFDQRLPDPPNPATAAVLRSEIQGCPRLVVLATENCHKSRWIPWELGLGDGFHNVPPNAILPATETGSMPPWIRTEYFHLYPKIVKLAGLWVVTLPSGPEWLSLHDWLRLAVR
ncbi:MAG: toll/interleukin-1 receptor domain-containing protein, partial [Candidatus Eisenbacteria bacterium]|nr:toll/interleukin-1 receptor domain-containing protein [Candidatus Eisenbacteria bacterium]